MNDARERILHHVARMGLHRAYEVGGAVRDGLRRLAEPFAAKDVDIAVVGNTFEELLALCRAEGSAAELVVARQRVGVRLTAPWTPREGVEFALARTEVSTGASRHQFAIDTHPGVTIEEDLARRDFTVNAIAREVGSGALIDPFGGARDLRAGVLRTVSERSFPEDPLRVLRGLVRCARDELVPEPTTAAQMRAWAADPRRYLGHAVDEASTGYRWYGDVPLSPERVYQELRKLLAARHAAHALRIARDTGVLAVLLPELQDSIGFDQRSRYHDMTVDEHTFHVLDHACAVGAPETVRLAALLHDCGKPATAWGWLTDGRACRPRSSAAPAAERRPARCTSTRGRATRRAAPTRSRAPSARSGRCCGSPRRPRSARRWCGSCASTCTATTTRSPRSPRARASVARAASCSASAPTPSRSCCCCAAATGPASARRSPTAGTPS